MDHSTEIALLKLNSVFAVALGETSIIAFPMLDLSATFDVIDHPILLNRLLVSFNINEMALKCVTT